MQEPDKGKCCETRPTVFRPYPRRLESLTVCRCNGKAALSPQLFKDSECWPGWGLNPRPPAQLNMLQFSKSYIFSLSNGDFDAGWN